MKVAAMVLVLVFLTAPMALVLVAIGVATGTVAGLLGVGGGVILDFERPNVFVRVTPGVEGGLDAQAVYAD